MKLIDKDALVAEIKRLIRKNELYLDDNATDTVRFQKTGAYSVLNEVLHFIDTLEVKDLQEEPKFKTGDRIKPVDSCLGSPRTIVDICNSWYVTNQGTLDFEYEDNWEAVEEPVSSIWHDSNKEQPNFASTVAIWNPKHKNGEIISRCTQVYSDRIWAYIDDLLKM